MASLKEMNTTYEKNYDEKISLIANWAEDHHTPTNSDEIIAQEVNAIEIDEDAKALALAGLPEQPVPQFKGQAHSSQLSVEELEAIRQQRLALEEESERWFTTEKKYDTILLKGFWTSPNDTVPNMAELVVKNCFYLCLGGNFRTPGEFYVNPIDTWNPLENTMAAMQKEYKMMSKAGVNIGVPWIGHLVPGFIVAARRHRRMEYHRAKILTVLDVDNYKVQFVDYGDIVVVPFREIRYLPLKFLQTMEFQAIQCTLRFNEDRPWTSEEGEYFRRLIFSKVMAIHFKEEHKIESGTTWEVDVHLYDEEQRKITDFHVERRVFQNGGRNLGPFNDNESEAEIKISKFNVFQT